MREPAASDQGCAAALEFCEDAVVCLDDSGTVLTWNRGASNLYGYSLEEILGQPMNVLAPADRAPQQRAIFEKVLAGESVQQFETVHLRKTGTPVEVSLSACPMRQNDRIVGVCQVARGISDRKLLESAAAQLAAIVESSEDPIFSADPAGLIRTWNAAAERVFGYSALEVVGQSTTSLAPADRQEEEDEILSRVRRGERIDYFETIRCCQDGSPVHVSLTVSPIRDRTGLLWGASYIVREIAERRRLEAANAQLAAIIESSEDAIVSKDLTGVIQTWNAGAQKVYGYEPLEAIGRNIAFLLPPGRDNEEQAILASLRRGERVDHFETKRLRKDGRQIDVSLGISPIRDRAGHIIGASHVARDVTERRQFELQMQQTQRLESLGVLAGGIAHDFNNLLTGVLGNASLIYEILPPEHPARSLAQDVTTAAERAASLTAQLLAYSGKGQFVIGPVDVGRVVTEICSLVKASVSKNVTIRLDLNHDAPKIQGDATQIHQLLMNLILNGAEAIGEHRPGTVVVKTEGRYLDLDHIKAGFATEGLAPGEYAHIEVRDDGCGMDEETRSRIFDPFFTTKFMGRGLGLAAALGIVNSHKGAIRVRSVPGQGSIFTVLLPSSEIGRGRRRAASKGTVLVVDDEDIVRRTAKMCLENRGYRVVTASNGAEAVERFRETSAEIDLVVLDLTMPVMGGEEALRQLRALRADLPVVLSSGYTEAEARGRFAIDGLAGFIQKPYASTRFIEKLEAVLKSRAYS